MVKMVSLWPWKGEDNSAASFEKALSALATKITQCQAHLDSLRSSSRRNKALWTLYASFAYLLCFIVLFLVVGWNNLTVVEYSALVGSPVIIYLVRTGLNAYYSYRIDNAARRLEEQQASRTKTIDKLKAATKYDSTQELLEKYGGAPPKHKKENKPPAKGKNTPQKTTPGRVGAGQIPPTANILRPGQIPSQPSTPQPQAQIKFGGNVSPPHLQPSPVRPTQTEEAGFAPNAFSSAPQYAQGSELSAGSHWYDRVLDLLMGEDETSPKNRFALICQSCRLVNGQAPPGTKGPADLGKWRCFGCGAWNGEEDEAVKVVQEMKERVESQAVSSPTETKVKEETEVDDESAREGEESQEDTIEVDISKRKPGRPKGSKKKA